MVFWRCELSRLIDADKAIPTLEGLTEQVQTEGATLVKALIFAALKSRSVIPTVDAVPVVHGRWVMMDGMKPPEWHHHHQCSVCESYAPMKPPYGGREELPPWCPGCGARMDGETEGKEE